jgi:hypothetical protein
MDKMNTIQTIAKNTGALTLMHIVTMILGLIFTVSLADVSVMLPLVNIRLRLHSPHYLRFLWIWDSTN